jgi:hypothetical protein
LLTRCTRKSGLGQFCAPGTGVLVNQTSAWSCRTTTARMRRGTRESATKDSPSSICRAVVDMGWTARSSTSKSTSHVWTGICYCISIPIGTSSSSISENSRDISGYPREGLPAGIVTKRRRFNGQVLAGPALLPNLHSIRAWGSFGVRCLEIWLPKITSPAAKIIAHNS